MTGPERRGRQRFRSCHENDHNCSQSTYDYQSKTDLLQPRRAARSCFGGTLFEISLFAPFSFWSCAHTGCPSGLTCAQHRARIRTAHACKDHSGAASRGEDDTRFRKRLYTHSITYADDRTSDGKRRAGTQTSAQGKSQRAGSLQVKLTRPNTPGSPTALKADPCAGTHQVRFILRPKPEDGSISASTARR